ncbi:MAG: ABC transporter permease [Treponema sp.]|jgi:phospholipid/cholesterol/gamma-HCH transport system permease protein|nr:ABC transporter permease [Treponema sp.]
MGNYISQRLEVVGKYFVFLGELLKCTVKRPFHLNQYLNEIEHLGINSLFVIILSSGSMGMIFALQIVAILQDFQAEIGAGAMVAVAMGREIAPVITALMLIAKNGSAMAAELGTMKVTEQIDALEAMSISAEHYLVLPKVAAAMVVFPILTVLANLIGSVGSFVVSVGLYGIESGGYINYLFDFLSPRDIFMGLIKAFVFGFIVSTICCFYGLNVSQGAKGVGDGATKAVVASSVAVLVADYLLTTIILRFIYQ